MVVALAALLPLALALVAAVALRRPAYLAAGIGLVAAGALILAIPAFSASTTGLVAASAAAGLITLSAAVVILPGLYLNEQLAARGVHAQLVAWTNQLPLATPTKTALIIVGIAPALESMTGFGVSLLVTVPLLLAIADRRTALRAALLSMNIMPWGTLGLATLIGASLAGQPTAALGLSTAVVSAAVFPLLGALAAASAAASGHRGAAAVPGGLLGLAFTIVLVSTNAIGLFSLAGVIAGTVTTVAALAMAARGRSLPALPARALLPYALLFALAMIIRIAPAVGAPVGIVEITAGGVAFNPLTSPGVALLLTILLLRRGTGGARPLHHALARAWRPVLAIAGFTALSQLMLASGMAGAIGEAVPAGTVAAVIPVAVAIGMVSGYITGSGVGGNALMMPTQTHIGQQLGDPLVLAAVQNSAAGHAVFAAMPIIALTLAIAGQPPRASAEPTSASRSEESQLARFALGIAAAVYIALVAGAYALDLIA